MPREDLSTASGLPLHLHVETAALEIGSGYSLEAPDVRTAADLNGIWRYPEAADSSPVYAIHFLAPVSATTTSLLQSLKLVLQRFFAL